MQKNEFYIIFHLLQINEKRVFQNLCINEEPNRSKLLGKLQTGI